MAHALSAYGAPPPSAPLRFSSLFRDSTASQTVLITQWLHRLQSKYLMQSHLIKYYVGQLSIHYSSISKTKCRASRQHHATHQVTEQAETMSISLWEGAHCNLLIMYYLISVTFELYRLYLHFILHLNNPSLTL